MTQTIASTTVPAAINNSGTVTRTGRFGITVAALAKALGCEYAMASQFINLAVFLKAAQGIGRHHNEGQRGRPTEVYDFSMETILTALANCGNIERIEVTDYKPPIMVQFPRKRVKTEREVAVLNVAPLGRPASEPLDFSDVGDTKTDIAVPAPLDFDDVGETAPHGVNAPVSSDTLDALADIALL